MILDVIRENMPEMASNSRKIASYILDHEESVAFSSIYTIAEAIGVSSAALVRFSKSLGLEGYQELKREVQKKIRSRLSPFEKTALRELDVLPEAKRLEKLYMSEMDNLRHTFANLRPDDIQAMADSVNHAHRIFVCGFGASAYVAASLEYSLLSIVDKDICLLTGSVSDYTPRLRTFTSDDAMFIMTFPPYSSEVRHVAEVAKEKGGRLNLLTDSASCPIYSFADSVVRISTDSLLLTNSYVGLISATNILVHLVFLAAKETSVAARAQTLTMQKIGYTSITKRRGAK